jgi:hypothetical protein
LVGRIHINTPTVTDGRGGGRPGSGRKKKRLIFSSGRPPSLSPVGRPPNDMADIMHNINNPDFVNIFSGKTGKSVTKDRCLEVLRAIYTAILELKSDPDIAWCTNDVREIVMRRCRCGKDLVNSALLALKAGTLNAIEEFFNNAVTTRVQKKLDLRILSPDMLSMLDTCIQSHLINSLVGVSVDAVRELIGSVGQIEVSRDTTWRAMKRLGYHYCKLKSKIKFTSKRRKRIEDFILEYDTALDLEEKNEAVIVYMDESYVHTRHKSQFGWDIKSELDDRINNCAVEQDSGEKRELREGEKAGGKGVRHVFLCALTKDGIVCDPAENTDTLRKQTYEPKIINSPDSQSSTSSWIFQANKKGTKDYHDNMDSDMFINWVKNK